MDLTHDDSLCPLQKTSFVELHPCCLCLGTNNKYLAGNITISQEHIAEKEVQQNSEKSTKETEGGISEGKKVSEARGRYIKGSKTGEWMRK